MIIRLSFDGEYSFNGVFNLLLTPQPGGWLQLLFQGRFMRFVSNIFCFLTKIFAFTSFMMGLYFLQDAFIKTCIIPQQSFKIELKYFSLGGVLPQRLVCYMYFLL